VQEFGVGAFEKGLLSAATLSGILVGATALGHLADVLGRKQMFIAEMAIFTFFLVLVSIAPNLPVLLVAFFGMGLALGCDYPTAHMVISESIPSAIRGRLVLSAFGFQAVGALAGTGLGYFILRSKESIEDWRLMFAAAILPAAAVVIGRFFIPQSSHWLVSTGQTREAEEAVEQLLRREPRYPKEVRLAQSSECEAHPGWAAQVRRLFKKKHRRATILASVPWFLQDLGTYGIGIFTPTILAVAIGGDIDHPRNLSDMIHSDMLAAEGAALIDTLLIVGIVAAVLLADRVGRIRLQITGFIGCAVGLVLAASASFVEPELRLPLIFAGFMLFNFMNNLGPNAMTYLIAGEVFPTQVRGLGAGFAASPRSARC
jgi:MFS family permease